MDWARESYGLSNADMDNIFRYGYGGGHVFQHMETDERPTISSLKDLREVREWSETACPALRSSRAGLVLLLLNHPGETPSLPAKRIESNDWLDRYEVSNEKQRALPSISNSRQSLKLVPFDHTTFRMITKTFHVHGSIGRTISRADAPVIARTRAVIDDDDQRHEAWIYNVRTSNAWKSDRAMTVTYFPHNGLIFGVVFGCQAATEAEIFKRLTLAGTDALHPLLVPGILIELERQRHIGLARSAISELETRIYQLNPRSDTMEIVSQSDMETLHREKRTKWLDMTYLRNCLVSWSDQLDNVGLFIAEIDAERQPRESLIGPYSHAPCLEPSPKSVSHQGVSGMHDSRLPSYTDQPPHVRAHESNHSFGRVEDEPVSRDSLYSDVTTRCGDLSPSLVQSHTIQSTSFKIKARVHALIKEYDDLIRDCTMRIDGMSMATQWAQGETNMEIAKATSRDSKHMRSISLVTMVFLPGTFFSGMFSTSFFNWRDGDSQPTFSSYLWVYIVITVVCTMLTVGLWYYFNVFRHRIRANKEQAAESPV
ncbi:magnesium transporter [Microdochium nivale]|nr:magnesium transporter [Microdochium nivale]